MSLRRKRGFRWRRSRRTADVWLSSCPLPAGRLPARIWLRRLDGLQPEEVTGSDGALSLFWAPDSQQLGFFTLRAVKKFTVSNGTVQTLCEPCEPALYGSGTWSRSGLIVFPSSGREAARFTRWRRGTRGDHKRRPIPGGP